MGKNKIQRVAVIGAGPAGAIATDALVKEQAFETVKVFDRQNMAGGTWVLTSDEGDGNFGIPSLSDLVKRRADFGVQIPYGNGFPCETAQTEDVNSPHLRFQCSGSYDQLHSNVPSDIMCFSQEPIPSLLSDQIRAQYGPESPFRSREVIRSWIENIFCQNNNDRLIEFGTTVELAEYVSDRNQNNSEGEWILTLRKVKPGQEKRNIWWQERFDAIVVASGHYYLPFIPDIPGLIEYDEKYPGRITHSKYYRGNKSFIGKRVIVVGGSISASDTAHEIREVAKLPVICSLRNPSLMFGKIPFIHPDIENRAPIVKLDAETGIITFADGSTVDDVDMILFATGYDFSVPYLSGFKSVHDRIPGIYQNIISINNPTLAFVGMVAGGFGIRVFEWQAVVAARLFAGRVQLPDRAEMEQWEQNRLATHGNGRPFYTYLPEFEAYYEELREIAGEPGPGCPGRKLPRYEQAWSDSFWQSVELRIQRWKHKAAEAVSSPKKTGVP